MRIALLASALLSWVACAGEPPSPAPNCISRGTGWIEFPGTLYAERYNSLSDRANGHHFIVWKGGGNAHKALIEADCPDAAILEALQEAGATPGNNLTTEAWNQRNNPDSQAPDTRVEGTPVMITVRWDGQDHPIHELFADSTPVAFDIRVGGHAELISVWRSGCVTCLFSCPGGRTSNAAYTIRDQAWDRHTFRANTDSLPLDGTTVTVRMTLVSQASSG